MAKPEKDKRNKTISGVSEEQLFGFTKEPSFDACQKEVDQYFDKKEKRKKADHDNVYFDTPPVNEQGDMLFVPDKQKKPKRVRNLAREKAPGISTQKEESLRTALSPDAAISPEEEEHLRSIVRKHCNTPDSDTPVFQDHCEVKNCAMNDKELQQLIRYFVEIQKQYGSILTEQEELIESYRDLVSKQTNLLAELIETVGKGKP